MLDSPEPLTKRLLGFCPLIGAGLGVALILAPASRHGVSAMVAAIFSSPILVFVTLEFLHLAFITVLWMRYRPVALPPDDALPTLTVIIPAYNEGPMVEQSIRSVAQANYPHDKLEILVVDDGSRDDTFFHMEKLRKLYPQVVRLIRLRGNQGKRAALRTGFETARGDIVITIDSDSEIEPNTLKSLAAPFANQKVGGVAGWVRVLNAKNFIGRMLDVQFTLSFDLSRAAQSTYGAVFVCPGALSAFRRSVILPFMDDWVNQSFLGHGEDQALTNIVLRAGYHTVYQRSAVVWTLVPQNYKQLRRMLTRWDRSYVVEGFSFARFMFTRYRTGNRVFPILGFMTSTFRLVYVFVGLVAIPGAILQRPDLVLSGLAAGLIMSSVTCLYYLRAQKGPRFLWGAVYALYSFVALSWILPYAIFTVREEGWGTR